MQEPPGVDSRGAEASIDRELMERVAAGDSDALGALYDRHGGLLLALSRRVLGNQQEAEEVVQEALLQAWKQAPRYDPRRSSVSTWLVLIARSRSIDRLRSRSVRARTDEQVALETPGDASGGQVAAVLSGERRQRLQRELAALPPEQREVLELAYYRGMTQSQIANQTGSPLGTVKTRTLLALRKLRLALADDVRELL